MSKAFWDGFFSVYENSLMKALILICALVIIVNTAYQIYSTYSTKSVTIDSKHFNCTATEPLGIIADCTQYTKIHGVR
jgi:hypothetical protein